MKISIQLKDPDGVYDSLLSALESGLTIEQHEEIIKKYFRYSEYVDLIYDTETKEMRIKPRY